MAAAGWDVFAGVRSSRDGTDLAAASDRINSIELDVTSVEHIAALDAVLPERLDGLVNNAGIVVGGALEAVPIEELREQFDVNVIAQVAVTQAVLPRLRASHGRIVFISSISGLVASPMMGPYAASKFAIEAIGDSLRMELRPWRIPVILVEPGQIDTDIWRNAQDQLETTVSAMSAEHRALYAKHIEGTRKAIPWAQRISSPVDRVAKTVEKALTTDRPKARYLTGRGAGSSKALARLASSAMRDRVVGGTSGVPRKV